MRGSSAITTLFALSTSLGEVAALSEKHWHKRADHLYLPKETSDYKTAAAPNNVTIRYKNPGICETTPGVDSYSGYVDLSPDVCFLSHDPYRRQIFTKYTGSRLLLVLRISQQSRQRPFHPLAQWRTWLRFADRSLRGKWSLLD